MAPFAGRQSDRKGPRWAVFISLFVALAASAVFWALGYRLAGLILGVVLLDAGVQGAQVANQSRVLSLLLEASNRANAVSVIAYFSDGSLGSLVGAWAWKRWGVCASGIAFLLIAMIGFFARGPENVDGRTSTIAS